MPKSILLLLPLLLVALTLIIIAVALSTQAPAPVEMAMGPMAEATEDPRRAMLLAADPGLQAGETAYNLRCAHCHGMSGEGELPSSAAETLALGMKIVPPHDSTGHTWMHPEQLLIRFIQQGAANPLYRFQMPAYGEVMTVEEIQQVIAYMQLWWTDAQREHYAALTAERAAIEAQFGGGG
jgi:mono/diheme cytochrome c family protein